MWSIMGCIIYICVRSDFNKEFQSRRVINAIVRLHGDRHTSSEAKEGAAGRQTTKQAQQAGAGGQEHLPSQE